MELFLRHVDPAYRCLVDGNSNWAVDFIGRVERIEEDMPQLIDSINANRRPGVAPLEVRDLRSRNVQSCDGSATVEVWHDSHGGTHLQGRRFAASATSAAAPEQCTAVDKYAGLYTAYP